MKRSWKRLEHRIDAMPLRTRALVFAVSAASILAICYLGWMSPQFARYGQLKTEAQQQQAQMVRLRSEVQRLSRVRTEDPDATEKKRLNELRAQILQTRESMLDMQKDLVAPSQMLALMEGLLRRNRKLQLKSLKTLPVSSLSDAIAEDARSQDRKPVAPAPSEARPITASNASTAESIYKHSMEIVVEGSYLDMLDYLKQLEAVPQRIFWGKAALHLEHYPAATLTLTVFTLSLEKRWMGI